MQTSKVFKLLRSLHRQQHVHGGNWWIDYLLDLT